jgi:hypothetical protein
MKKPARAARAACFCLALPLWLGLLHFLTPPNSQAAGLDWRRENGGRSAPLSVPGSGQAGFTLLPGPTTGLFFTNWLAQDRHLTNQILLNGSGVAAGDVDGDGRCDLYFCGLDGPNALFRNLGDWKFEDITATAGVACPGMDATGAALADLDGDGDLDLIVNTVGSGTRIFLNDGHAHFQELTPPLNPQRCGTSLALADIDGDGDLDIYVANYRTVTIRDQPNTRFSFRNVNGQQQVVSVDGRPITDPDLIDRFVFRFSSDDAAGRGRFAYEENGEPDLLLRNEGGGRFTPVPFTGGAFLDEDGRPLSKPPFDWGLSVMFRDLNGDGAPDLYVCNDFKSPDRIWINDGHGRFRALAPLAIRQTCLSSMGVDVADVNRDGIDDLLVVDMLSRDHVHRFTQNFDLKPESLPIGAIANRPQSPRNMLLVGRGDGTWAECAQFSGLEASEWSWTPIFLDVDLDGYEDVLISNGFERDGFNMDVLRELERLKKERPLPPLEQLRLRRLFPRLETAPLAFRNLGGLKFQDVSQAWGFVERGVAPGMCLADLDNDGDLDVVINQLNGPAKLYRNNTSAPRLAVRLHGRPPNTRGIGAKIKVLGGAVPVQTQEMISGGRYLSSDDAVRVFAPGQATGGMTVEVTWRSGRRTTLQDAQPNRIYEIDEPAAAGTPLPPSAPTSAPPWFTDVSTLIGHAHHEDPFDDFARQPTLPKRLSQLGPGASWFDVDDDGWDDLILPAGKGGTMAIFRNDQHGGFTPLASSALAAPVLRDQTTVLGWRPGSRPATLLAGSANYEDPQTPGPVLRIYQVAAGTVDDSIPGQESSTGPLAMADVDGDGQLELFVGGRVRPGRYPAPASSILLRQREGRWEIDRDNAAVLADIGLVSGAVFSDLDGDGSPDLVLACEWGSLVVLRNQHGKLAAWDAPVLVARPGAASPPERRTLGQLTGWWNGVTTGDFDGDGRMDIAASNWGGNSRYESFRGQPLRVFYGEPPGAGFTLVVEGYLQSGASRLLPLQPFQVMGHALPEMRERMGSFDAYARAALPEIYAPAWSTLKERQATWLESTVFLNRGDHFEAVVLPLEAQLAPAFAVNAADLDGDGHVDLFLSQNFFSTPPHVSRYDAGRGLWLRGDGRGGFQAVPGQESGLSIYGEQRGAALADYDQDGRVDLVVTQNGAATKLYRNRGAQPGLRVRLAGPAGNPNGIGAILRPIAGDHTGPACEIHAGSGYWSQDSAVQIFAGVPAPDRLSVRWPGGKVVTSIVPRDAREVTIGVTGGILNSR